MLTAVIRGDQKKVAGFADALKKELAGLKLPLRRAIGLEVVRSGAEFYSQFPPTAEFAEIAKLKSEAQKTLEPLTIISIWVSAECGGAATFVVSGRFCVNAAFTTVGGVVTEIVANVSTVAGLASLDQFNFNLNPGDAYSWVEYTVTALDPSPQIWLTIVALLDKAGIRFGFVPVLVSR